VRFWNLIRCCGIQQTRHTLLSKMLVAIATNVCAQPVAAKDASCMRESQFPTISLSMSYRILSCSVGVVLHGIRGIASRSMGLWDIIFGYLDFPDCLSLAKSSLQVHVPISSNISISILIIRGFTKPLGQRLNCPTY
jgi:hypothetical protein